VCGVNPRKQDAFYGDLPFLWERTLNRYKGWLTPAWVVIERRQPRAQFALPTMEDCMLELYRARFIHVLIAAQDWASAEYGVRFWRKDEWGSYGDARIVPCRVRVCLRAVA
jgi:hypothetical protein